MLAVVLIGLAGWSAGGGPVSRSGFARLRRISSGNCAVSTSTIPKCVCGVQVEP